MRLSVAVTGMKARCVCLGSPTPCLVCLFSCNATCRAVCCATLLCVVLCCAGLCAVLCCLLQRELLREVSEKPVLQYVPSFGYVSLFPLLMQLIPADSDILGQQLQLLQAPELLWTDKGLRSLATTSSIYNK